MSDNEKVETNFDEGLFANQESKEPDQDEVHTSVESDKLLTMKTTAE